MAGFVKIRGSHTASTWKTLSLEIARSLAPAAQCRKVVWAASGKVYHCIFDRGSRVRVGELEKACLVW